MATSPHRDLHSFPTRRSSDLEYIDADVVVLADSDARPPDPGFIARLVERLDDASAGLVTCVPSYRGARDLGSGLDRKSTRLNSSHLGISYAVFCLKKKNKYMQ